MLDHLPDWKAQPKAQKLAALAPMIEQNMSSAQIAEQYRNCTKNSVLGFCHKNGLKVHGFTPPPPKQSKHGNKDQPKAVAIVARAALKAPTPPAEPLDMEDGEGNDVGHLVGLLSLERTSCRWPVRGEGSATLFCGEHAAPGPYCATHAAVAGAGYVRRRP